MPEEREDDLNPRTGHTADCPCVDCSYAELQAHWDEPEWTAEDQARAEEAYRRGEWASNMCPRCHALDDQHAEGCPCAAGVGQED